MTEYILDLSADDARTLIKMRRLVREAGELDALCDNLRAQMPTAPRGIDYDGMPHGSGTHDAMAKAVAQMVDMERKRDRVRAKCKALQKDAERVTDKMPPRICAFAVVYYLLGESVQTGANKIGFSVRQCWRWKRQIEKCK